MNASFVTGYYRRFGPCTLARQPFPFSCSPIYTRKLLLSFFLFRCVFKIRIKENAKQALALEKFGTRNGVSLFWGDLGGSSGQLGRPWKDPSIAVNQKMRQMNQ